MPYIKFPLPPASHLCMMSPQVKKQMSELIARHNCHPLKAGLVLWFQFPFWIGLSMALRNLAWALPARDAGTSQPYLSSLYRHHYRLSTTTLRQSTNASTASLCGTCRCALLQSISLRLLPTHFNVFFTIMCGNNQYSTKVESGCRHGTIR